MGAQERKYSEGDRDSREESHAGREQPLNTESRTSSYRWHSVILSLLGLGKIRGGDILAEIGAATSSPRAILRPLQFWSILGFLVALFVPFGLTVWFCFPGAIPFPGGLYDGVTWGMLEMGVIFLVLSVCVRLLVFIHPCMTPSTKRLRQLLRWCDFLFLLPLSGLLFSSGLVLDTSDYWSVPECLGYEDLVEWSCRITQVLCLCVGILWTTRVWVISQSNRSRTRKLLIGLVSAGTFLVIQIALLLWSSLARQYFYRVAE